MLVYNNTLFTPLIADDFDDNSEDEKLIVQTMKCIDKPLRDIAKKIWEEFLKLMWNEIQTMVQADNDIEGLYVLCIKVHEILL